MALELHQELVLLCEGAADQAFFRKLIEAHSLPKFDMLPPSEYSSASNFGRMLKALTGDRRGFSRLKGILVIADSKDEPSSTFSDIQRQIEQAGGYAVPGKLSEPSSARADRPAVAVTLLPSDNEPGALETLCVREIVGRHPWIANCVDAYLTCEKIDVLSWGVEKIDKAKYHCMVAALNKSDPSRAVSQAFRSPDPFLDIRADCFKPTAEKLRDFCRAVGVC